MGYDKGRHIYFVYGTTSLNTGHTHQFIFCYTN
ncbi:YmaF family protein [Clostridium colicanis]